MREAQKRSKSLRTYSISSDPAKPEPPKILWKFGKQRLLAALNEKANILNAFAYFSVGDGL